jgi:hypothetical protein
MHLPNLQFFFAAGLGVLLAEVPKLAAQQRKDSDAPESDPRELRAAARSGGISSPSPERG